MTQPKKSDPVRLAIIGAGTTGTIHGLCSLEAPEVTVTTVWSRSPDKAAALAEKLGAKACDSLEAAVNDPDVDAAMICTPTFLHEQHAVAAIQAGKHVICEKPLARDLGQGSHMLEAADAQGVQLCVAHVVRFFPEFRRMHDLVQEGRVGKPALARMSRASAFPRGSDCWQNDLASSGGVLFDMGIHDLDWLLWTFGPAKRGYARGLYQHSLPFVDYALTTLRFENDMMAHVESSWAEQGGFRVHGELSGDEGMLTYDSLNSTALEIKLRDPRDAAPGVSVPTSYTSESPYTTQLRHFARCMRGQEEPIISPQEAYESLRLALAALQSITTGQPVSL